MTTKKAFKRIRVYCLQHIHGLQQESEKLKDQKMAKEAIDRELHEFSLALDIIKRFIEDKLEE